MSQFGGFPIHNAISDKLGDALFTLHCGKWSTLQYDICIGLDVIAHIRLRLRSQRACAVKCFTRNALTQ